MLAYQRRVVLGKLGAVVFGGCVGHNTDDIAGENSTTTTDPATEGPTDDEDGSTIKDKQMEDTEDTTDERHTDREEELDRLPDRSPIATTLEDLYVAEDRQIFAERHDALEYEDGAVKVSIRLEPDEDPPEDYLPEDRSGYGDLIVAVVEIDDLIDLALDDNVRAVRLPPQQEPHSDE